MAKFELVLKAADIKGTIIDCKLAVEMDKDEINASSDGLLKVVELIRNELNNVGDCRKEERWCGYQYNPTFHIKNEFREEFKIRVARRIQTVFFKKFPAASNEQYETVVRIAEVFLFDLANTDTNRIARDIEHIESENNFTRLTPKMRDTLAGWIYTLGIQSGYVVWGSR